jgi:hypothetical protein
MRSKSDPDPQWGPGQYSLLFRLGQGKNGRVVPRTSTLVWNQYWNLVSGSPHRPEGAARANGSTLAGYFGTLTAMVGSVVAVRKFGDVRLRVWKYVSTPRPTRIFFAGKNREDTTHA